MENHSTPPTPTTTDTPDERCDAVWIEFLVAVEHLPPLSRLALLLCEVLGKPVEEVATMLGRDTDTCRWLVDDARTRLRAIRAGRHGDCA